MRISDWSSDVCSSDLFAIDAAAFHIDWTDIQLFTVINGFGLNANGGKEKSDGFEFTATLRPARGFVFSLNGAYTNARLQAVTDPNVGGLSGDRPPLSSHVIWKPTLSADLGSGACPDA